MADTPAPPVPDDESVPADLDGLGVIVRGVAQQAQMAAIQARWVHAEKQHAAALDAAMVAMGFGSTPPALLLPVRVLDQAAQALGRKEYALAVVFAQAACEVYTETALSELMHIRKAEFLSDSVLPRQSVSLEDKRTHKIFIALTGEKQTKSLPWWPKWDASRSLRHGVAHKLVDANQQQAADAIESAEAYILHIAQVVQNTRQMHAPPT
jgi:hypothetical protein